MMLDDEQALFPQQTVICGPKFIQDKVVVHLIRRIEKDDVPTGSGLSSRKGLGLQIDHFSLAFRHFEKVEVFLDQRTRPARLVDKGRESRSARECFDTDRTRTGTKVEKTGFIVDSGSQDIEEC